jgi:hypothetical protein
MTVCPKTSAILGALLWLVSGCFVQGEEEHTVVSIRLGIDGDPKGRTVEPDETIDLADHRCFVGVEVNADDMPEPVVAAWACDPGEDAPLSAELELTVHAGASREIRAVAFVKEDGWITTFASYDATDLTPGLVELKLTLDELEVGSVDGLISGAPADVVQVILTDLDSGVRMPPVDATASGGGFHFDIPWIPRGRFFGLTLILVGGEPLEMLDCPIYVTPGSVRVLDVDATNGSC